MRTPSFAVFAALLVGVVVLPRAAAACDTYPGLAVVIRCKAATMGPNGVTRPFSAWTKKIPLNGGGGQSASVAIGDYAVSGALQCSGTGDGPMQYGLEVRLSRKGLPYASPLHLAMLSNLELPARKDRPPLTVTSYYFFSPDLELDGIKYSRLDYSCGLEVTAP
jgi:hypothetical protein